MRGSRGRVHNPQDGSQNCEERDGGASLDGVINQRQKICLIPVDEQGNLLRAKPKDWNENKNNKFMIINDQHNIAASKELQLEGCGKERQHALEKWDAIIM
jgi:hypothetical protein